jgi:hypothetical protein
MLNIYQDFLSFLKKYFESVSIFYHIIFLCFLVWVKYFREPSKKIPKLFVHMLGLYVILYGFIILYYGSSIINNGLK